MLDPAGTGTVEFNANTTVDGNIHATQNITAAGNLTLGSGADDDIVIGYNNGGSKVIKIDEFKKLIKPFNPI